MRILIVSNTYPPADISGVGALVYELAHQLGSEAGGDFVRVLTRVAPPQDPFAVAVGGGKVSFVVKCGWRYLRLAWRERYDLIHVHESDGAAVVFAWWMLRLLGAKPGRARLVATLQVSYDEERRMVRPVLADGEVVSEPTSEERRFAFKARIQSLLGRLTVRLADAVVAPSEVTKEELRRDYGAAKVEVIYNGIALDAAGEGSGVVVERVDIERTETTRAPTVLYAGRLRTRKAVAVLLVAFRHVLEQMPQARLVIVGDGEQREALESLQARLELGEAVRFTGKVARRQLGEFYREADVYCLPSLYEGFPLAILEAMAASLPVVATRVSGNPEAVIDGETGLLVAPERAESLAAALLELLTDPARARAMGERGRQRLVEHFTIERIAEDYRRLWHNLADGVDSPDSPDSPDSADSADSRSGSVRSDSSNDSRGDL